jgi:hypothetical protein
VSDYRLLGASSLNTRSTSIKVDLPRMSILGISFTTSHPHTTSLTNNNHQEKSKLEQVIAITYNACMIYFLHKITRFLTISIKLNKSAPELHQKTYYYVE